jgi:hypothetical protein
MPLLQLHDRGGYAAFDEKECRTAGEAMAERYKAGDPFPHIVLDDFVSQDLLRSVLANFPDRENKRFFARDQERFKFEWQPQECGGLAARMLFAELNSKAFLRFLSALTGIPGLIADPYYSGAGFHETMPGGHLSIHADFNRHGAMKVERRLNLLIYLNDDWDEAWGGKLELWDKEMTACRVAVPPVLGRAVIFNTDLDSFHGHPDPLTCPEGRTRRSIATYYYTAFETGAATIDRYTTFKTRPNSGDRRDWSISLAHVLRDWTPPILQRKLRV